MTNKQVIRENNIHTVTLAALELFLKNGIEHSTIDDIATHANVSKMSIFRYFETKVDIVKATTIELFNNTEYKFNKSKFSHDNTMLTGIQLAKKQLDIFIVVIDEYPQFLNYLCELVLFFSRNKVDLDFPQNKQLEDLWIAALERGMSDKSIGFIENYKTFYRTLHNLFIGVILRLYLEKRNLSSPEILPELKGRISRIVDMTIKYLEP